MSAEKAEEEKRSAPNAPSIVALVIMPTVNLAIDITEWLYSDP
jgi:hypothetical protein